MSILDRLKSWHVIQDSPLNILIEFWPKYIKNEYVLT
jgi:hypothetical protein